MTQTTLSNSHGSQDRKDSIVTASKITINNYKFYLNLFASIIMLLFPREIRSQCIEMAIMVLMMILLLFSSHYTRDILKVKELCSSVPPYWELWVDAMSSTDRVVYGNKRTLSLTVTHRYTSITSTTEEGRGIPNRTGTQDKGEEQKIFG